MLHTIRLGCANYGLYPPVAGYLARRDHEKNVNGLQLVRKPLYTLAFNELLPDLAQKPGTTVISIDIPTSQIGAQTQYWLILLS